MKDLLIPRFKLIADYPGSDNVGTIYIMSSERETLRFSKYPYLFKKLGWWEERSPKEMTEYVKHKNGTVLKIFELGEHVLASEMWGVVGQSGGVVKEDCTPSTKEEYANYKKLIEEPNLQRSVARM